MQEVDSFFSKKNDVMTSILVHSIVLLIFIVHIIVFFHCRFHPQIPRKSQVPVGSPSRSCFRWIYLSNLATNLWQRAAWLARCWNLGGNWEDLAWWLEDDLSLSIYIIIYILYILYIIYIPYLCVCVEGGTLKGLQSITNQSSKVIQRQPNGQDKNGRWICYIWRKLTLDQNTLGWLQEATNVLWVGTRGFRHSNICFVSVRSKVATHTVSKCIKRRLSSSLRVQTVAVGQTLLPLKKQVTEW